MGLETGTYIDDLVATNPVAGDNVSQGDDHIRLLKSTVLASFPNITGAMTATQDDLNQIDNGQFAFPATQNASADVNTLDDYEEGTWTPELWDASESDAESQTYSDREGTYTKIGRLVYINGYIALSSLGSLTGASNATIGGLPFDSANGRPAVNVGQCTGMAITAGTSVAGIIIAGTPSKISLQNFDATTGSTGMTLTEFSASGSIRFSAHYEVA